MSSTVESLSQSQVDLVEKTANGVVAVKIAPHRIVSGVCLQESLVAVAHHALRRDEGIRLQTAAGATGTATVLGRDGSVDVAILKAEGVALQPLLPAAAETLKAGMLAAVVGMTMDVGPSVSLGTVGAVGPARRTWRGGTLDQFLRLDVALYPSQTGAAVVDAGGRLIGLATPALSRHAAIAVPAATLQRMAGELLREGRFRKGYLGLGMQPVAIEPKVAAKLAHPPATGLIVLSLEPDSPAEKAGLHVGDILIELDGKSTGDLDELQAALRGDAVGKTVEAVVVRGGEVQRIPVTVAERK